MTPRHLCRLDSPLGRIEITGEVWLLGHEGIGHSDIALFELIGADPASSGVESQGQS